MKTQFNGSSGGSRISQGGGAPTYYLPNFYRKLHENEKNLAERGGGARPLRHPLDPPPGSIVTVPYWNWLRSTGELRQVQVMWGRGTFMLCLCKWPNTHGLPHDMLLFLIWMSLSGDLFVNSCCTVKLVRWKCIIWFYSLKCFVYLVWTQCTQPDTHALFLFGRLEAD